MPNAKRQASGANAKVSLKNRGLPHQPQASGLLPTRGTSHVQNSSAVIHQQPPQHRAPAHAHELKPDPYDTDGESLDTTVNLSVVQVEDSQEKEQQYILQQPTGDHVNESDDADEEYEEEFEFSDEDDLPPDDLALLLKGGMIKQPREVRLVFLERARGPRLPTVEGDSYPETTDGNLTEHDGGPEPPPTDFRSFERNANALQPQIKAEPFNRPSQARPHQQGQMPNQVRTDQIPQRPANFSQPLTNQRDQQLFMRHPQPRGSTHQDTAQFLASSQPPSYSQANSNIHPSVPLHSQNRPSIPKQNRRPSPQIHQHQYDRTQAQFRQDELREPLSPPRGSHPVAAKFESAVQQQPLTAPPIEVNNNIVGDYEPEKLSKMNYDQLKKESFDYDPGAGPQVFPDDLQQKSLEERLEYAHKNLDADRQSAFFSSLPATEWEEAGDWLLEQFQNVIQRTRDARRKKRKLAKDFEDEVEERHKHVMKKQRQVEGAMNKMKAQGEGLVAKSPKPFKSPKMKRG